MSAENGHDTRSLAVDVWSDVGCPFCYMGDTTLAEALTGFPHRDSVSVRYHSFQLMPGLEEGVHHDLADLLSSARGVSREVAEEMNAQTTARAADYGLTYRLDQAKASSTLRAHELSHLAAKHGVQHEVMQGLFAAYFTEGQPIGDMDALADVGAAAGLDRTEVLQALRTREFASDVEADLDAARRLGITGVPFFVFGGKYVVQGAQSAATIRNALDTAWAELA